MKSLEKKLAKIIRDWVGKNFGTQEMEDPSWDIDALAEEIAKHNTELFWITEREYIKEDVEYEADLMKVELTERQKRKVAEEYINSESYGVIDQETLEYFINKIKREEV